MINASISYNDSRRIITVIVISVIIYNQILEGGSHPAIFGPTEINTAHDHEISRLPFGRECLRIFQELSSTNFYVQKYYIGPAICGFLHIARPGCCLSSPWLRDLELMNYKPEGCAGHSILVMNVLFSLLLMFMSNQPGCCYANPRFAGVCVVQPARSETCSSILNYLNSPGSSGKTYCDSTEVRGEWKQVRCGS
jgi:hypothetical protein